MATLKKILFGQCAGEGLNSLLAEMQKKYNPKKGRRFNHANITYEVGRPGVVDVNIQFEISSKIPQDELKGNKDMENYFKAIKKLVTTLNISQSLSKWKISSGIPKRVRKKKGIM